MGVFRNNDPKSSTKASSPVRSALRYAFVPRIGKNVGEVGQTLGLFPRMLASIFVMQGLFPGNHPALRDPSMRLKMTDVVAAAYSQVQWNREGLPKALFFLAVVGSIIFSVIAFGFAFMGFFASPAHAAGIFTAPDPATDLSNSWLEHVFNGANFTVQVPTYGAGFLPNIATVPQTFLGGATSPAGMFRALAAMYSNAMLVLAVIIVVYHLLSMIVHTAHDGTPMGKGAHQIWTPVRFVFALGLLVPVAGGFSSGQWLILWLAKQGSGLASNVWGSPAIGGNFVQLGTRMTVKPDTNPAALIDNLYTVGYCAKDKQMQQAPDRGYYIGNVENPIGSNVYPAALNATPAQAENVANALTLTAAGAAVTEITTKAKVVQIAGPKVDPGNISKFYYPVSEDTPLPSGTFQAGWADTPCGSVTFPAQQADPTAAAHPDAAAIQAVNQAHVAAFNAIEIPSLQLGATMAARKHRRQGGNGLSTYNQVANPANGSGIQITDSRRQLMALYRNTYGFAINGAGVPGLSYDANSDQVIYNPPAGTGAVAGNTGLGGPGDLGWMSAGGYFISMATRTGRMASSAFLSAQVQECDTLGENNCPAREAMEALDAQTRQEEARTAAIVENTGGGGGWFDILGYLNRAAMAILGTVGLANDQGQLMWHTTFGSPFPLSDMINMGEKLVDAALLLFLIGAVFSFIGSVGGVVDSFTSLATSRVTGGTTGSKSGFFKGGLSKISRLLTRGGPVGMVLSLLTGMAAVVAPIFFAMASLIVVPGIMLFYLLPLLPFLNFFTGIITWMVSLLQAVVAIPVIAIAHLTPQGEGLPSGTARGAYTMMLQIFLRPVMMIFGLIVSVLIINTGIGLLNVMFLNIFKASMSGSQSGFFSSLMHFALYTAACWAIVNAAITAIDDFPLKAVTWIGGSQGVDRDHNFGAVAQAVAGAAAYQGFKEAGNITQGLAQAPAGALNNFLGNRNSGAKFDGARPPQLPGGGAPGGTGTIGAGGPAGGPGAPNMPSGDRSPPPAGYNTTESGLLVPNGVGNGARTPAQQSAMMDAAGMRQGSTGLGMDGRGNGTGGSGLLGADGRPLGGGQGAAPFTRGSGSRAANVIRGAAPATALPMIAGRLTGSGQAGSASWVAQQRGGMINEASQRHGIDARFLAAQQAQESGAAGTNAVSSVGARGVAQFMPATAREYNVNVNDDRSSTMGQARYMRVLSDRYHGDMVKATAAYNWGMGNVDNAVKNYGSNWLSHAPQETQQYVARIDGYMRQDFGTGLTGAAPGQLPTGAGYGTPNVGPNDAGVPRHMLIAESMIGANENRHRSQLNDYLAGAGVRNSADGRSLVDVAQTPWCAGFVDASLRRAGLQGTGSLAADSYNNFGMDTRNDARVGDIVTVDWNGDGQTDHVAFIAGVNRDGSFQILGGNQTDRGAGRSDGQSVTMSRVSASQVMAVRRATGAQAGGTSWEGGESYPAQEQQPQIGALGALVYGLMGIGGGGVAPGGINPSMAGASIDGQPAAPQQTEAPKSEPGMISAIGHGILGIASFIPGVSVVAGGIDAAWYTAEGDYVNAGLAAASMIPGGKWVTTGGKLIYKGARVAGAGVKMSRVAAKTGAAGLKVARGAGALAREARVWNALSGGGVSGGMGTPVKRDEGMDIIMMLLGKQALDYIQNKGRVPDEKPA